MTLLEYMEDNELTKSQVALKAAVKIPTVAKAMTSNKTRSAFLLAWAHDNGIELVGSHIVERTASTRSYKMPDDEDENLLLVHMLKKKVGKVAIKAHEYDDFERMAKLNKFKITLESENFYRRIYTFEKRR